MSQLCCVLAPRHAIKNKNSFVNRMQRKTKVLVPGGISIKHYYRASYNSPSSCDHFLVPTDAERFGGVKGNHCTL